MHVVFKVLVSTSIKRRKPWPRLTWIGKEKQDLLLLGDRRASILYLPSGKTKRRIPKLHALIKDCISLAYTSNGLYVIGLLTSGNIFVWCKDSGVVSHISGLVDLQSRSQSSYKWRPKLFSSDDCNKLLVVIMGTLTTEIYVYQCKRDFQQSEDGSSSNSIEAWWRCGTDGDVTPLRPRVSKDMTLDARFATDDIFGRCCCLAFVYSSESSIHLVTLLIQWFPNNAFPIHHWRKMILPYAHVSIDAKQVTRKGAFIARWSNDGRILAIAVNQESIDQDKLVFVSPHCKVLFIATLPREFSGLRHHRWICDLAWTRNDLFVVSINHLGSMCLLSRLGEPLYIATSGCSMDLPVSLSLNIHPFIFVMPHNETDQNSITATSDILKQRFSVCCHPSLPIFLCSDGYMVTCLQFPQSLMDPFKFIDVCCRQSEKYLRVMQKCIHLASATLDVTEDQSLLSSTFHQSAIRVHDFTVHNGIGLDSLENLPIENEEHSESDSSNLKSEQILHHYSSVGKYESGSLVFGGQGTDGSRLRPATYRKNKCQSYQQLLTDTKDATGSLLLSIWGLLVTVNETWAMEWEVQAKKASDLFAKVCAACFPSFHQTMTIEKFTPESSFASVTSLITSLVNLCRFCALNKAIMPIILNTLITVFMHLIKCAEKLPLPLQIVQLMQLANLLESVEKTFSNVFATFANQLLYFSSQNNQKNAVFATSPMSKVGRNHTLRKNKRLAPIWIVLYKDTMKLIGNCTENGENCITLLGRLQRKLQDFGMDLNLNTRRYKVGKAEKALVCDPFKYENAVEYWKVQVEASLEGTNEKSQKTSVRLLHSILYTLLGGYHLKDAIYLIYWLMTRDRTNQIDHGLRHPAIRHTVRSFARFMAAYFVVEQLHVYPFHCPRYFPSLRRLQSHQTRQRVVPVCRSKLTQVLSSESLAHHWTADVTIALFLSSGYIEEAAQLVHLLGDWKTAFVLFYASRIALESKSAKSLSQRILESQLREMAESHCTSQRAFKQSFQRLTPSFQNCFLAGALCDVDAVSLILESQMKELQRLMRQLPLIVPMDVYLPHPPPYCPQPSEQNPVPSSSEEKKLRRQIARHIQLFIVLLQTLQCTVYFMDIYLTNLTLLAEQIEQVMSVKELSNGDWPLQDLFLKLKGNLGELDKFSPEQMQRLDTLAMYFRDFCTFCWFLHVRDEMNMHLRKFWQRLMKNGSMPAKFCLNALRWAVHLIPFAESVGWNLDVYHLIISILLEAPRDRRSSFILAQCFPDMSQIPTELDYRISTLLNVWRNTIIKVPSNRRQPRTRKTLSVIHLNQCDVVRNMSCQLKDILGDFDKVIFASRPIGHLVQFKARVFEVEKDYFTFLGLMFDVGIIKDSLEDYTAQAEIPILNVFKDRLKHRYIVRPLAADKGSLDGSKRKRSAIRELFIDADMLKETRERLDLRSSKNLELHTKKAGLFRSLSLTELNPRIAMESSFRPLSGRVKSLSNLYKSNAKKKSKKDSTPILPKSSSLLSLCDAIDVDPTWERLQSQEQMFEILSWLVKWMKRVDLTGTLSEESANAPPRMKIQVTFNQLVSAVHQAVSIATNRKLLVSLSVSKANVAGGFLTSTPLSDKINATKCSKQQKQCFVNDGFLRKENKYREGAKSAKSKAVTRQLSWSECSNDRQFEVSTVDTLTSDNSFSSLVSDNNLPSESAIVSDDLISATTSKWTNSGPLPEISPIIKGIQPSAKLAFSPVFCHDPHKDLSEPLAPTLSSSTATKELKISISNPMRALKSTAAPTKDFACGDGPIWGSRLIDTCIQVNDESLMGTSGYLAKKREHLMEFDQTSTCDDTQNDACSLPIATTASVSEAHSSQKRTIVTVDRRNNNSQKHQDRRCEQEHAQSAISMVKKDTRENETPDFTRVRLLRLPAEKELCATNNVLQSAKKAIATLSDNKGRGIPALLQLDRECKFIKKTALPTKDQAQPKMLSHQEIQRLQSKLRGSGVHSQHPDKASNKHTSPKCVVPPLLQLNTSSRFMTKPSHHLKSTVDSNQITALASQYSNVPMSAKVATHSRGVQTKAEWEHFVATRSAVCSLGVQTVAEKGQFTMASGSQTSGVTMKHSSTLTNNYQRQHASTGTDIPACLATIGINTSQQDDIPKSNESIKHLATKQTNTETLMVVQATQTSAPCPIQNADNSHRSDNAGRSIPSTALFISQNMKSGLQVDLEKQLMGNNRASLSNFQPAHEETRDKPCRTIDLKAMRERLKRLQNEGLLNEDTNRLMRKNLQLLDEMPPPTSIDMRGVEASPIKSYPKKPFEESDVRAEFLSWMESQTAERQQEFKRESDGLKQAKKEPFAPRRPVETTINTARAEVQRRKRQQMHVDHFTERENEAVRLMQELLQDEVPLVRKTVKLKRSQPIAKQSNRSIRSAHAPKRDHPRDFHATYTLKGNPEDISRSLPASPSRKLVSSNFVSCPTSPKTPRARVRPTTYIERLQALQPSRSKARSHLAHTENHDHLMDGMDLPSSVPQIAEFTTSSETSSCDTLTPWIVPEEVQHLLFGRTYQNQSIR